MWRNTITGDQVESGEDRCSRAADERQGEPEHRDRIIDAVRFAIETGNS